MDIVGGKILQPVSGWVIVKKEVHQATSIVKKELAKVPYKSIQEREGIMRMLCGKWHVDNVRVFLSIMPD